VAKRLGLWDVIFNPEIVPVLESSKKWEADHEERAKQVPHEVFPKELAPCVRSLIVI
jgi:hypothetical protein